MLNQILNQNYFINTKYTSSKSENSSTFGDMLNTFTLKIHDEKGNKALTSTTLANGGSASVFEKSDGEYIVKAWDNEGRVKEYSVNVNEVNPSSASYFELLAYSSHNDKIGKTSSALRDFLSASAGVRNDNFYTFNDIERKIDLKSMLKEFMNMQKDLNPIVYNHMLEFYNIM